MTDAHAGAACGNEVPAACKPGVDRGLRQLAELAGSTRPAREHFQLDVAILWREVPVGGAGDDRVAHALERTHGGEPRLRAKRRAEALVAPLMPIHRRDDLQVERLGRLER